MVHMLPLNAENKHKEWSTILHIAETSGFPYAIISKLHTPITQELILPPSHNIYTFQPLKLGHFHSLAPNDKKIYRSFQNYKYPNHIPYM